jgi:hypothetical protein
MTSIWRALVLLTALTAVAPAEAADIWIAAHVRGSVFALVDNQWTELRNGDGVASGIAVRTLQAGHVQLLRRGELLQLDPNSAIRASAGGDTLTVEQYGGVLTLNEAGGSRYQLITPAFVATVSGASLTSRVAGNGATLSVRSGRVPVSMHGRSLVVLAGQTLSGSTGTTSSMEGATGEGTDADDASPAADQAGDAPAGPSVGPAAGPAAGTTAPGKTDNGVGNGGVPGNGGQNGNAGGKANNNSKK